jgi:hypothetical protein
METVIYKYPLEVTDVQDIEIPYGSILLSIQTQNEKPCLWALIYNTQAKKEIIRLRTIGTGNPISKEDLYPINFIGTYQLGGGSFVGHVFQVTS